MTRDKSRDLLHQDLTVGLELSFTLLSRQRLDRISHSSRRITMYYDDRQLRCQSLFISVLDT